MDLPSLASPWTYHEIRGFAPNADGVVQAVTVTLQSDVDFSLVLTSAAGDDSEEAITTATTPYT